jgi:hypothetical protein
MGISECMESPLNPVVQLARAEDECGLIVRPFCEVAAKVVLTGAKAVYGQQGERGGGDLCEDGERVHAVTGAAA